MQDPKTTGIHADPAFDSFPPLLSEKQVARMLNISTKKLQLQRQRQQGIPYIKTERTVRYRKSMVLDYLAQHEVTMRHDG